MCFIVAEIHTRAWRDELWNRVPFTFYALWSYGRMWQNTACGYIKFCLFALIRRKFLYKLIQALNAFYSNKKLILLYIPYIFFGQIKHRCKVLQWWNSVSLWIRNIRATIHVNRRKYEQNGVGFEVHILTEKPKGKSEILHTNLLACEYCVKWRSHLPILG